MAKFTAAVKGARFCAAERTLDGEDERIDWTPGEQGFERPSGASPKGHNSLIPCRTASRGESREGKPLS